MTRILFYVHESQQPQTAELLACRVAERALEEGFRPWLRTESEPQAHAMDKLLWTFKEGSFLPHGLWDGDQDEPLLIGPADAAIPPDRDMLINLAPALPEQASAWKRIAEIADQRPERVAPARERFRQYRELGLSPEHHIIRTP